MAKNKEGIIEAEGVVIQDLSNSIFNVELTNGFIVKCVINGKIRMNNVRIFVGDSVKVELSCYDLTQGRITYRYNTGETYNPNYNRNNGRAGKGKKKK
jgi:translation initiation factor IF-1